MPPSALRALRHRDFRLFWLAQLLSLTGTWLQSLGQAWLVLELTGSPFRLGLVSALQFGPFLLLSFVAGVVVDRLPKRRLILATQCLLACQAATLAALIMTGQVRYWHVAALALAAGIVNTLDMPARQSFIVEMVGREDLHNAIALNSAAFNAARAVGPAIAGLLIGELGVGVAFAINAVSFLAPVGALMAVGTEGIGTPRDRGTVRGEIAEGFAYAARTPRIRFVLGLLFFVSLFIFNYNVIVPLFAREVLRLDARGLGFLMASLGAGALAGAIALAVRARERPSLGSIIAAGVVLSSAALSMAAVRDVRLGMLLLFAMGASGIVFMASCNTTLQLGAPDTLRGRVMSLYSFVFVGVTPIGSFMMGWLAEHGGVPVAYAIGGSGSLVAVLALGLLRRARRRHSITTL
jgi:predicted MFS family arabinose efflux permease